MCSDPPQTRGRDLPAPHHTPHRSSTAALAVRRAPLRPRHRLDARNQDIAAVDVAVDWAVRLGHRAVIPSRPPHRDHLTRDSVLRRAPGLCHRRWLRCQSHRRNGSGGHGHKDRRGSQGGHDSSHHARTTTDARRRHGTSAVITPMHGRRPTIQRPGPARTDQKRRHMRTLNGIAAPHRAAPRLFHDVFSWLRQPSAAKKRPRCRRRTSPAWRAGPGSWPQGFPPWCARRSS